MRAGCLGVCIYLFEDKKQERSCTRGGICFCRLLSNDDVATMIHESQHANKILYRTITKLLPYSIASLILVMLS